MDGHHAAQAQPQCRSPKGFRQILTVESRPNLDKAAVRKDAGSMSSWWFSAVTVLILTLLSFFVFPGHTILQADTQIYIPILEHIADPSLLTTDIMAVRPHVSFTLYDEAALLLIRVSGLSFEHVLMGQQFVYRGVGVLGLYLFAM